MIMLIALFLFALFDSEQLLSYKNSIGVLDSLWVTLSGGFHIISTSVEWLSHVKRVEESNATPGQHKFPYANNLNDI
ncbi:hypothetical protein B9Z19DRAFT_1091036 [Tuber borchii]|uniref:Uncharacterized protein n=1 Tax=Tuber borchii TaxID=42251 RepID=A0A2T6ZI25_TUBBO|nr:hypothetical protein B9Z19DRAFT_1091036 [Tuber borchii]